MVTDVFHIHICRILYFVIIEGQSEPLMTNLTCLWKKTQTDMERAN